MKISNYYFAEAGRKKWVVVPNVSDEKCFEALNISIVGKVFDRPSFPDGSVIITSPIKKIVDGIAYTMSGSCYELGEVHEDYQEILDAEVPIINLFTLKGNIRDGYMLDGCTDAGKEIKGRITAQNGNTVEIDGTKCLVIWQNNNLQYYEIAEIALMQRYLDMQFPRDFERYLYDTMKPKRLVM